MRNVEMVSKYISLAVLLFGVAACAGAKDAASVNGTGVDLKSVAQGESHPYIMVGEILPNVLPPIVIEATIRVGFAMLAGASLSFLGLGVQPPQADWGLMIRDARQYIFLSSWPLLCPGLALAAAIVGFNLLGDGLRDRLGGRA